MNSRDTPDWTTTPITPELYGEADVAGLALPDELHPDATTHRLMGERFAERAFGVGGPFAPAVASAG